MELTLEALQKLHPCSDGLAWWKKSKCGTVESTIKKLLAEKRFAWANWLIACSLSHDNQARYAIYAARQVLDIYEKRYPDDLRVRRAIETAEAYLKDKTEENRNAAAAYADAAYAAYAAAVAAYADAAYAAYAAYAAAAYADAAYAAYAAVAADAAYAAAAYAAAAADAAAAAAAARVAADAYAAAADAAAAARVAADDMKKKIIEYGVSLINVLGK